MEKQINCEENHNNPIRPFCLEYVDTKNEIFCAINKSAHKHNIPMFLMENILMEALYQVREAARIEIENAKTLFEKQTSKPNK